MQTIKKDDGTYVYLTSKEQVRNIKILMIVFIVVTVFSTVISLIKNNLNYYLLIIEAITIAILILVYYLSKKSSNNPFITMKKGILNVHSKLEINFKDITKIQLPPLSNTLYITYKYQDQLSAQPIFSNNNPYRVKLFAEIIKEYADSNGFNNIEYDNCLFLEKEKN